MLLVVSLAAKTSFPETVVYLNPFVAVPSAEA
jgi:hypothetical protein